MKIKDYIKKVFDEPDMSDADMDAILWGCCLIKQLSHAKRALARGYTVDEISAGADKEKDRERKKLPTRV